MPPVPLSRRRIPGTALVSGIAAGAFGSGRAFAVPGTAAGGDPADPHDKDIAMRIMSSAQKSPPDRRAQFGYIGDGRGCTAGTVGFCSGTGDMLELVESYTGTDPDNALARYL